MIDPMMNLLKNQLFPLGHITSTPGALVAFKEAGEYPEKYLQRHVNGDWGDLCKEDIAVNEEALKEGFRLMSAYTLGNGTKVWLVTESDRSSTTFLLPFEYQMFTNLSL